MYQFTTETIINTLVDSKNTKLAKFLPWKSGKSIKKAGSAADATEDTFRVTRVGDFEVDRILGDEEAASAVHAMFRTEATSAFCEGITGLDTLCEDVELNPGEVVRLEIVLKKTGDFQSDYANDLTYYSKTLWYEAVVEEGASGVPWEGLQKAWAGELAQSDNAYVTLSIAEDNKVNLECVDPAQNFVSVKLQKVHTPLNGTAEYTSLTGLDSYEDLIDILAAAKEAGASNFQAGTIGFGSYRQLLKNHRLPTLDATYWTALHLEERPVPGAMYNMYVIRYKSVRKDMGISAVAQEVASITTHVFYVRTDIVSDFEAAVTAPQGLVDGKKITIVPAHA
jgi:hypothetical protein